MSRLGATVGEPAARAAQELEICVIELQAEKKNTKGIPR